MIAANTASYTVENATPFARILMLSVGIFVIAVIVYAVVSLLKRK